MKNRERMIFLMVFILYILMVGVAYLIWWNYGYQTGVTSCISISVIFLILFLLSSIYYLKKVESPLKISMILANISIFIGLCWSISRYTDADEIAILLLYLWSVTLFIGLVLFIYSFVKGKTRT